MPESSEVDVEVAAVMGNPAADAVFTAWRSAHSRVMVADLLGGLPEPGPIALRCRFRHLLDAGRPDMERGQWMLPRQRWDDLIALETRADMALRRGPAFSAQARELFEALRASECQPQCRVVTVNAVQGLADVARHHDEADAALDLLKRALDIAAADGYRFGRLRALVSAGYLTMPFAITAAAENFTEALVLAEHIGDRLFLANALLGLAEVRQRQRDWTTAQDHAQRALTQFERLRSPMGIGNAASRLADILVHGGQRGRARELLARAATAFADAGAAIGQVNVLDTLGDVALGDGDVAASVAHHRDAVEISERIGYLRGRAASIAGMAAAARAGRVWPEARQLSEAALGAYTDLGDPLGQSNALEGLAICAEKTTDVTAAVRYRCAAVRVLETMRATLTRPDLQAEYRSRFVGTYRRAIQTAVDAADKTALLWVLECLAGRRLAGLVEQSSTNAAPPNADLLAQLVASADSYWQSTQPAEDTINDPAHTLLDRVADRLRTPANDTGRDPLGKPAMIEERRARILRKMSALAIKHTLAEPAAKALEELVAVLYLPPPEDMTPLIEALPDADTLVIEIGLLGAHTATWVHRDQHGQWTTGRTDLDGLDAVLDDLDGQNATPQSLARLAGLLPPPAVARIADGTATRLLVIPIGRARGVPWTALPLPDDCVLGEVMPVAVCPSLTVQRALRNRLAERPPWPARPRVGLWRNPSLLHHRLRMFDGAEIVDPEWLDTATHAHSAFREPGHDLLVVVAHGRPVPGGGHYQQLDDHVVLTQADVLGAVPPRRIALIACWGAHVPGMGEDADPLTIAALLLAQGCEQIVATTGELGDSAQATRLVEQVIAGLVGADAATAVHHALVRVLRDARMRRGSLRHWAPLQAYGTFTTRPLPH